MIINNPNDIKSGFPWLVFANNTIDPIAKIIDFKTDITGVQPKNHAMLSINQGEFAVQNMTLINAYRTVPMSSYMIKGQTLSFVNLVNSNAQFVNAFSKSVQKRLSRPGFENGYDFLGLLGQALENPIVDTSWIHTPGLEYCSVDVIRHLVNACPYLPKEDQIIINGIPRETNPEQLWEILLNNPKTFYFYGDYNFSDKT
jgi:hypothetical protein